jgi:hypothetical protein
VVYSGKSRVILWLGADHASMRTDHSLQEARAGRQYRAYSRALIVLWFALDDIFLCAIVGSRGSDAVFGFVLFSS